MSQDLNQQMLTVDIQKKRSDIKKDKATIVNDMEDLRIQKVYSLIRLLECTQPDEAKAVFSERAEKIMLSGRELDIVKNKIFELIQSY